MIKKERKKDYYNKQRSTRGTGKERSQHKRGRSILRQCNSSELSGDVGYNESLLSLRIFLSNFSAIDAKKLLK